MTRRVFIPALHTLKADALPLRIRPSLSEFKAWKTKVRVVLVEALGQQDHLVTQLDVGTYTSPAIVKGRPQNVFDNAIIEGINNSCALIDAAIMALELRSTAGRASPDAPEVLDCKELVSQMSTYYHVMIKLTTPAGGGITKLDMKETSLLEKVIRPYEAGTTITIAGRNIDPFLISRIRITQSDVSSAQLQTQAEAKFTGGAFTYIPRSIDEMIVGLGQDVTDDFMSGAPGSKAALDEVVVTRSKHGDASKVFLIQGRDSRPSKAITELLNSVSLHPLEWGEVKLSTGEASPYVGTIIDKGFELARAAVVLFTPDDEAKLKEQFWGRTEPDFEKRLTGQARPNVLFEAGMAMALFPRRTVLVEMGELRPSLTLAAGIQFEWMVVQSNAKRSFPL